MPKLFVYFVRMHSKDFYLTLNIIDILACLINTGLFQAGSIIKLGHYYSGWVWLLEVALLISAVIALFYYFSKRYYRTKAHTAYMIIRIFASIVKFLLYSMILFGMLSAIANSKRKVDGYTFTFVILTECYCILSLYWSYHLMKIVN